MDFSVSGVWVWLLHLLRFFYKPSKVGDAIWFRRCAYLILEFSNASFLATLHHIKWQAFSIGSTLGRLAKRFNAVVWGDFGANAGFLCFSRKRKAWFLLSPLWKTSEPCETPRIFSQPILDYFQEVILGLKTCIPWHVIKPFPFDTCSCYIKRGLC